MIARERSVALFNLTAGRGGYALGMDDPRDGQEICDDHNDRDDGDDREQRIALGVSLGLSLGAGLGVALGAAIGAATDDLAIWIALGIPIGAGLGLTAGIIVAEMQQRAAAGECPKCGYPTKGLRTTVCPECGVDFSEATQRDAEAGQG